MTQNQVAYQALMENQRHNTAMEDLTQQQIKIKNRKVSVQEGLGIANTIMGALGLGAKILSGGRIR